MKMGSFIIEAGPGGRAGSDRPAGKGSVQNNSTIRHGRRESSLPAAAWNRGSRTFVAPARYRNLQDMGTVLGKGCGSPFMAKHSSYPQRGNKLGNRQEESAAAGKVAHSAGEAPCCAASGREPAGRSAEQTHQRQKQ